MPWIAAGASLLGGVMQADSAGDAAATQAAATDRSNARLEKQYQQTRDDLAPWRNTGSAASNKLSQLLGLSGVGGMSYDQARSQLLPQYTKAAQPSPGTPYYASTEAGGQWITPDAGTPASVDENALTTAIQQLMAQNPGTQAGGDDFGSLLKPFGMDDFEADPSYQFRKDEGMKGLERSAAARGGLLGGAALKGLTRFNSDLASQEYGNAYNRNASTKRQQYDFLSGTSNSGQNAAAGTASAGTAMAGQVGANTTALGNAQGAAQIAQGNAYGGGIQNAVNGYQQNELMNKIMGGNSGFGSRSSARGYTVPDYPGAEY